MTSAGRPALTILPWAALALAALPLAPARAERVRPYLDLPITQSVNRDGIIRYAVWITVGDRSVQAMIDTGSTGLRVLPSVLPGDFPGVQTDITFAAGIRMEGLAVTAPIEIGSLRGSAPVEIVDRVSCAKDRPDCVAARFDRNSYLIGGEYASEGYSAILGIGLPFHGTDIGNPLQALGATRWIVDLPRPFAAADGHLILEPDASARAGFTMLDRDGSADAAGCIEGGPLTAAKCGTVLFDTGAPAISVAADDIETASSWDAGARGVLSFTAGDKILKLPFEAGANGGLLGVDALPSNPLAPPETFIMAGVTPYFSYDVLYEAATHAVGLRTRTPLPARREVADEDGR